ncbi:MAG: hypothetical protein JETT_2629 [Candidatus Jettenia ecosi]|uniref:Uncharacterized protein n=1 Tax=Candidatus Jettenia ecosi TaxID=2494326 RepID=A0A533Q8U8_9BACT|nr:MAG: hypothetical protein JETT_2629 [Candidatus Jettenia ecosi]
MTPDTILPQNKGFLLIYTQRHESDKYLNINICILKTPVYKDTGTKICGQVLTNLRSPIPHFHED